jgi:hypothetical protein
MGAARRARCWSSPPPLRAARRLTARRARGWARLSHAKEAPGQPVPQLLARVEVLAVQGRRGRAAGARCASEVPELKRPPGVIQEWFLCRTQSSWLM